jgi:penicillin V acylase-like amidase (Ntn superfamily)
MVPRKPPHREVIMTIKKIVVLLLILLFTLSFAIPLTPCSTFFARAKQVKLFGRNYDFFTHTGFVALNPRGVVKQALVYPGESPAAWTSQYGSLTFNQVGREYPTGGMNQAGLVIECMWLSQTQYPLKDSRPCVMEMQWMQYVLDTCATVDQVVEADRKVRIQSKGQPLHFLVADRNGNAMIVEFISFYTYFYPVDRKHPATLTNSSYADCLKYLERFKGFGGKEPIRKTIYSVDRFARLASAIKDKNPTVEKAFFWLETVSAKPGEAGDSYTSWSVVYDPVNLKIFFKIFGIQGIHRLNFSDFSFECKNQARALDFENIAGDSLKDLFVPLTTELNTRLVKRTFAIFKKNNFLSDMPDMYLDVLGNYPASFRCREN